MHTFLIDLMIGIDYTAGSIGQSADPSILY